MNQIVNITAASAAATEALTMSSREIAKLTGKRHDHVMRDIRDMLEDLGECPPKFGGTSTVRQPNGGERQIPCFNLPKRETLILISGYSTRIRARIIDRWMELEAEAQSCEAAYTADQQAMPMPELFAQLMQQQAETSRVLAETQRMIAGLLTAPKETEVKKDGRLISAREARAARPESRHRLGISKFGDTYRDRPAAGWAR